MIRSGMSTSMRVSQPKDAGLAERPCKDFMNKLLRNYTPVPPKGHGESGHCASVGAGGGIPLRVIITG